MTFSAVNAQTNLDLVKAYGYYDETLDANVFLHPNTSLLLDCSETCFSIPDSVYKYLQKNDLITDIGKFQIPA